MKYLKNLKMFIDKSKPTMKAYYKIVQNLSVGDYVAIEMKNSIYKDDIGEVIDITDDSVYVSFIGKKTHGTSWINKKYIINASKYKKDIEEFIQAKEDSEKYNL